MNLPVGLRILAFATVSLHLAWTLSLLPREAPATDETVMRLLELARLEPEPEPVPEEAPAPPPAEPVAEPEPMVADRYDAARGAASRPGERPFPAVSASYDDLGSFDRYARAMLDLGARFVVVRGMEVVGEVDIHTRRAGPVGALTGFSSRARNYTDEPALRPLSQVATEAFGEGASLRMIVPRRLDAALFGSLARAIESNGRSIDELREIRGRYRRAAGGGIAFATESVVASDGGVTPLRVTIDLSRIAVDAG